MVEVLRARRGPITLVGIKIEPEEPFVIVGESLQLSVRAQPKQANKGSITWSGGNTTQIKQSNGLITGVKAESRLSIAARSDAGFSDWVYARCGYDVTAISLEASELTIEGIQGVLFAFSATPAGSTEISFTFTSDDTSIADYCWHSTAARQRMWGYGAGTTTVTAKGRSGKAEYPCKVTVTPVDVESIDVRQFGTAEETEQGDKLPEQITSATMIVGSDWIMPIYFFPFNTTQRIIKAESSDENVATVDARNGEAPYCDRDTGIARLRYGLVSAWNTGETTLTLTPEQGEPYTIKLNVVEASAIYGTASTTGSTKTTAIVTFSFKAAVLVGDIRISGSTTNWTSFSQIRNAGSIRGLYQQSVGGESSYGTWWAVMQMRDGTMKQISASASWSSS